MARRRRPRTTKDPVGGATPTPRETPPPESLAPARRPAVSEAWTLRGRSSPAANRHPVARSRAIVAAVAVAVLIGGVALAAPAVILAVGGVVAALLPGAALGWSVRRGRPHPLDLVPAAALAVATVPLGGLLLNVLPFGVAAGSWLILGAGLLVVAWLLPEGRLHHFGTARLPSVPSLRALAMLGVGLSLTVAAFVVAGNRGPASPEPFTQVWLVPATDLDGGAAAAGDGPGSSGATGSAAAELGIVNLEGGATRYRVELYLDGTAVGTWQDLELPAGGTWQVAVPEAVPDGSLLEARVYLAGGDQPHRIARLWGPVGSASAGAPSQGTGSAAGAGGSG